MLRPLFIVLLTVTSLAGCGRDSSSPAAATEPTELVIYSARNEQLIAPLLDAYGADHGLKITLVTADAGPLLERLKAEGENTRADLLLTVDAGNLWQAAELGLLAAVDSPALARSIPPHLRDPEKNWFGLSVRARTIVHHQERAPASTLSSYAALATPAFAGRLCLRTSQKVYNQSLVAMLIAQLGEEQTEAIVRGWVNNLAAPPFPNDTAVMQAIAAGQCDVGIVNTYYFGRLQRDDKAADLALFWADQASAGVHVNISGGGVTRHSDQKKAATALLEWLAAPVAQAQFAASNLEYPANPAVPAVAEVRGWGDFRPNLINVSEAGRRQAAAVKLMDRAGYR